MGYPAQADLRAPFKGEARKSRRGRHSGLRYAHRLRWRQVHRICPSVRQHRSCQEDRAQTPSDQGWTQRSSDQECEEAAQGEEEQGKEVPKKKKKKKKKKKS